MWKQAGSSHSALELEQRLNHGVLVCCGERVEEGQPEQSVADVLGDRAIAGFAAVAGGGSDQ